MTSSDSVRGAVERGLPDTIAFLQELVRIPSLLGNEEPAQQLVEKRLNGLGFDVRSIEPSAERLASQPESGIPLVSYEGRRCLVGTLAGGSGRSLLFNGHVDVVSEAPEERWTRPPFGADVDDGRLYGRGACDMKGGIAAMLLGVEAALSDGPSSRAGCLPERHRGGVRRKRRSYGVPRGPVGGRSRHRRADERRFRRRRLSASSGRGSPSRPARDTPRTRTKTRTPSRQPSPRSRRCTRSRRS